MNARYHRHFMSLMYWVFVMGLLKKFRVCVRVIAIVIIVLILPNSLNIS